METRQDRKKDGPTAHGRYIHSLFNRVFIKRKPWTDEERQVSKVFRYIKKQFGLKIVCSEKRIDGFSTDSKGLEGPYYWSGKIDAIGLMDGDGKNGCGVVVLDWRTCSDTGKFWENAEYEDKLHQCMIYRRLLAVHMREHFKDPNIPEPGITIVALGGDTVRVKDLRLCMDFTMLEKAGIFKKLDRFKWYVNLSGENESVEGHKKAIPTVCCLLLLRSVN